MDNPQFIQLTNKAETLADTIIKYSRTILPTTGRLFLTSTFIEDGFRMWFQWSDQRDYIAYHWNFPMFCGTFFVLFNLLAQLGGSGMVLFRRHVRAACAILLTIVLVQTAAYNVLWSANFFFRNLSLIGGLALLFTETFESGRRSLFAGLPQLDRARAPVNFIQLFGRITLVFMFLTIQRWELSFFYDFFQTLSIIGGLLLLISLGPGKVSLDHQRRDL